MPRLLFENFISKVRTLEKGSLMLKLIIRGLFIILGITLVLIIVYSILTKDYLIILIILGVVIIAESAHFIRKSREKQLSAEIKKEQAKESVKEILKKEETKNKRLLKSSKPKNKNLLRVN